MCKSAQTNVFILVKIVDLPTHLVFFQTFYANNCKLRKLYWQCYCQLSYYQYSSTTNPKPKGQPSISLPAQANLTQQKAEPLRCLALRTRGGRLKRALLSHGNSPYPPKWLMDMGTRDHNYTFREINRISSKYYYYISL